MMDIAAASRDASERFLQDFHDRMPGGSPPAFTLCTLRDESGENHAHTYAALVSSVEQLSAAHCAHALRLLDLACGDGFLLSQFSDRFGGRQPTFDVTGVDLSRGELRAARTRLGGAPKLLQARAQALPFADATFDMVTCHMALMLMQEPDTVLCEIGRVLTPAGALHAVVGASVARPNQPAAPIWRAWQQALQGEPRSPIWQNVSFAPGRRWREREPLHTLLSTHFAQVRIELLQGCLSLTAEEAWQWLAGMYDLHLLPAEAHPRVRHRFIDSASSLADASGRLPLDLASWLIVAQRPKLVSQS